MKKVFESVTKSIRDVSEEVTKTITETSNNNNKGLENLNNKLQEILKDRGILAPYLMSLLSTITNPVITTHFKLVKDSISNRVNDLIIHKSTPIALHDNLLTFRDTSKEFESQGDLLKIITNRNYNVGLVSLSDKKLMYEFPKAINFNIKAQGNKSTRDRTFVKILESPAIMVSGVTTKILSENPDEWCDGLKLLLQQKQTGNNSDLINEEIIAIVDMFLEDKKISKKQHKQVLTECNLLHIKKK